MIGTKILAATVLAVAVMAGCEDTTDTTDTTTPTTPTTPTPEPTVGDPATTMPAEGTTDAAGAAATKPAAP